MTTTRWDPLKFVHAPEGAAAAELPLRLLVVDAFSGRAEAARPVMVTRASLDQVLRERGVRLALDLDNVLCPEAGPLADVGLSIEAMADFEPAALIERVPPLTAAAALQAELRALKGQAEADIAGLALRYDPALLASLGLEGERAGADALSYAHAELTLRLSDQLDALLHHPHLQAIEAAWRGLQLIVDQLDDDGLCRLDLYDTTKPALADDLDGGEVGRSDFFQRVYEDEFGQFGGEPYAAIVCGFEFEPTEPDLALLRGIAAVAAIAHAPFIAAAGPRFLGARRFDELPGLNHLAELHRGPQFARWRGFTEEPNSRYVGLTLPRVLLRAPYGAGGGSAYREQVSAESAHLLWGSAAYAFAGGLLRSFREYRVCVDIVGQPGGEVTGLPSLGEGRLPLEVLVSEGKEAELADLGLIPLAADRARDSLSFYSANTVHWAAVRDLKSEDPAHALGLRLGAQLPYLFLVSRIAHYLKLIQRDAVGTVKSAEELQADLNGWLRRYVADVENPEAAVRARRPLRRAELTVAQVREGWFHMRLTVTPHVKYLGQDYELSLEGRLGPG